MMRNMSCRVPRASRIAWGLVVSLAAVAGCGPVGLDRVPVSGTVTFNGEPLKTGDMRFVPINGTHAPVGAANIIDGRYAADGKGGVAVGAYRVEILAWRDKKDHVAPALLPPGVKKEDLAKEQYLPAKYNTQSELDITIAPGSGKIVRDFALTD